LEKIKKEHKLCYLLGDYNINLLNSDTHQLTAKFVDTMFMYGYIPLTNKPTRIGSYSATLIDNIYTNNISASNTKSGVFYTDITDHFPVFHITGNKINTSAREFVHKRFFTTENIAQFTCLLKNINWNEILTEQDTQSMFTCFHKTFLQLFNDCFPVRKIYKNYKNKLEWITVGIKKSIKHKNALYMRYKRYPTHALLKAYKTYKSVLASLLKSAEKNYYDQLFTVYQSNLSKSWKLLKTIINKNRKQQTQQTTKFVLGEKIITDNSEIADQFNKHSVNVGASLDEKIPRTNISPTSYISKSITNSIFFEPIIHEEVISIINSLRNSSPGWDNIPADIIKKTCNTFIAPLTYILNLAMLEGTQVV